MPTIRTCPARAYVSIVWCFFSLIPCSPAAKSIPLDAATPRGSAAKSYSTPCGPATIPVLTLPLSTQFPHRILPSLTAASAVLLAAPPQNRQPCDPCYDSLWPRREISAHYCFRSKLSSRLRRETLWYSSRPCRETVNTVVSSGAPRGPAAKPLLPAASAAHLVPLRPYSPVGSSSSAGSTTG
jgi:hypothetical protein